MALFVAPEIGIDLGTSNTQVYVKGEGIAVSEPSVLLIEANNKRSVKAIGDDAQLLLGRTGQDVVVIRPLSEGVISDFDMTANMIRSFIRRAIGSSYLIGPKVLLSVPCSITSIERRAVMEATQVAGARKNQVHLVEKPFAAALGSGLPVYEPIGSMVVDIGGGTTDIAVISLGGIVLYQAIRVGGIKMDEAIINYIRHEFNIEIGDKTAEDVKLDLGSAIPLPEERKVVVRGRDVITNLPQTTELSSLQVYEALHEPCLAILESIKKVFERTPPELAVDIMRNGIHLTGGGALLYGMDQFIANEISIPVMLAKEPADAAVLGLGYITENQEAFMRLSRNGLLNNQ
jgi:cell shape determining protein, MreB/Mrl family